MTSSSEPPKVHPASPKPGQLLAGRYRVERVLGVGGMGIVVAAHHLELDERVAVKLMLPDALGSKEAVARFLREAKAAVKIKSEHIARVSDVGRLASGEPYLVMEYLEGTDLDGWLRTRGPLPLEQAAEFVIQACEALAEAHSLGIVHRDLKPANLFCTLRADGLLAIKILDFGISKAAPGSGGSDFQGTQTKTVMGSPLYMSPEQLDSPRNTDARGDIWALGAVLYELISGDPPFVAESLPGLVLRITQHEPVSVRALRPELPARIESVILRCLRKNRDQRYQSVAELAQALAEFAPKRALASVERAQRIVDTAGIGAGALAASAPRQELVPTLLAGQLPTPPDSLAVASSAASSGSATQSSFGQTSVNRSAKRRPIYVLLGLCAAGAVIAGVVVMARAPLSPRAEPSSAPSAVAALAPSGAPSLAPPVPVAPAGPLVTATVDTAPALASSPPEVPPAPVAKAPTKKAAPAPKPAPAKAPVKSLNGLIEDRR